MDKVQVPGSVFWLLTLNLAKGMEGHASDIEVLSSNLELGLFLTISLLEVLNLYSSLSLAWLDLLGLELVLNLQFRVLALELELSSLLVAFGLKLNLLGPCAILA